MAKATKKAAAGKSSGKKAAVKSAPRKVAAKKAAGRTPAPKSAPSQSRSTASATKATQVNDQSMLQELFMDSLKDIYWAEKSLTKALPRMAKASTSQQLRQAFEEHLRVTQVQIGRLERVFELLGKKAQAKKCEAMAGLTKEAEEMISETKKGSMTRDVALIMAAQKVEHYEIATYGSLATLAAQLGMPEAKQLLGETLQEEKDADMQLSEQAEGFVNAQAEQEGNS